MQPVDAGPGSRRGWSVDPETDRAPDPLPFWLRSASITRGYTGFVYAILLLILVAVLSLLITRVATVALTVTGMTRESARFQARSALTGAGFTTSESEMVVNHPVRRRIVMGLMLLGSVGLVTGVAGLLAGMLGAARTDQQLVRGALLLGGLILVYLVSLSNWVDQRLSRLIMSLLRRYTNLEVQDYARLLHLAGEYSVKEMAVRPGDWMAGRPLGELRVKDEGVLVLGVVQRGGTYIGAPGKDTVISAGDIVILYGCDAILGELDVRRNGGDGDEAHHREAEVHSRQADQPHRRTGSEAASGGPDDRPADRGQSRVRWRMS